MIWTKIRHLFLTIAAGAVVLNIIYEGILLMFYRYWWKRSFFQKTCPIQYYRAKTIHEVWRKWPKSITFGQNGWKPYPLGPHTPIKLIWKSIYSPPSCGTLARTSISRHNIKCKKKERADRFLAILFENKSVRYSFTQSWELKWQNLMEREKKGATQEKRRRDVRWKRRRRGFLRNSLKTSQQNIASLSHENWIGKTWERLNKRGHSRERREFIFLSY